MLVHRAQFQRALRRGNATIALGLAHEVKNVSLADALTLCLLIGLAVDRALIRWLYHEATSAFP